jgi:hypothetical protein
MGAFLFLEKQIGPHWRWDCRRGPSNLGQHLAGGGRFIEKDQKYRYFGHPIGFSADSAPI